MREKDVKRVLYPPIFLQQQGKYIFYAPDFLNLSSLPSSKKKKNVLLHSFQIIIGT